MDVEKKAMVALVAEDFEIIRSAIINELGKLGIECMEAENGEIALEILRSNDNINILITDIGMPVLDGYSLLRKIYTMPEYEKFRVIPKFIYSGDVDTDPADCDDVIIRVSKMEGIVVLINTVKRKLNI